VRLYSDEPTVLLVKKEKGGKAVGEGPVFFQATDTQIVAWVPADGDDPALWTCRIDNDWEDLEEYEVLAGMYAASPGNDNDALKIRLAGKSTVAEFLALRLADLQAEKNPSPSPEDRKQESGDLEEAGAASILEYKMLDRNYQQGKNVEDKFIQHERQLEESRQETEKVKPSFKAKDFEEHAKDVKVCSSQFIEMVHVCTSLLVCIRCNWI
jgi:hypothetical protein